MDDRPPIRSRDRTAMRSRTLDQFNARKMVNQPKKRTTYMIRPPAPRELEGAVEAIMWDRNRHVRLKPSKLSMILLDQERNDVGTIIDVVRFCIVAITKSPRYYIHRFHKIIESQRIIRHVYFKTRTRFFVKLRRIVEHWSMLEEAQRRAEVAEQRKRKGGRGRVAFVPPTAPPPAPTPAPSPETAGSLNSSSGMAAAIVATGPGGNKPGADTSDISLSHWSTFIPAEVKVRVLLTFYKRLKSQFLLQWRQWVMLRNRYENCVRDYARLSQAKRELLMRDLVAPPKEPEFKWLEQLQGIPKEELITMAAKLQRADTGASVIEEHGDLLTEGMRERIRQQSSGDDDPWVDLSMHSMSQSMSFIRENFRKRTNVVQIKAPSKKENTVESRYLNADLYMDAGQRYALRNGSAGSKNRFALNAKMLALKELPTLSKFKGEGWHCPPRALANPIRSRADLRNIPGVDNMTRTLAYRGITHAPLTRDKALMEKRESVLQVCQRERTRLSVSYASSKELLRSTRAIHLVSGQPKVLQRTRPTSAPPR